MTSFYSTLDKNVSVSLKEAILNGMAPDGGLYMPKKIPQLPITFFNNIKNLSFQEIAFEVSRLILNKAIPEDDLRTIIERALTFDTPLKKVCEQVYSLELFHGPTLSFKDFGASFLAQLMGYFVRNQERVLNILVATSGDTGSAIAQAFLDVPGIKVWILYPKGMVSLIQEKQLTTVGHNITVFEVEGVFDDCQNLVKQAFSDRDLRQQMQLTSANSINVGRLIPQSFYYFNSYARLEDKRSSIVVSVPSGNFGNLTGGLLAKKMGLPIHRFIASTNINDSVPKYLQSGVFTPHPSHHTLSNAMDVGNPSNFVRMLDIYGHEWKKMKDDIFGVSFNDQVTESAIHDVYEQYGYLMDPHGAVAYLGLCKYQKQHLHENTQGIFLETAHPAKFASDVERVINRKMPLPDVLQKLLQKEKHTNVISTSYEVFKEALLH